MGQTYAVYQTSLGPVSILCIDGQIGGLIFGHRPYVGAKEEKTPLSDRCFVQLSEYLAGERKRFDLPLYLEGTAFPKKVWEALCTIPYGQTRSYADIAAQIGAPKACRAVGMANNRDPIAILVPCHRVVGKNGSLTGYAGGLEIKKRLLDLEKQHI